MSINAIPSTFRESNLVVGAGLTGLSCLRYLERKGMSSKIYDDAINEDKLKKIRQISTVTDVYDSESDLDEVLKNVNTLLLSPGIPFDHPLVAKAQKKSLELIGDIELFARENSKPVLAVTGSNAKSTVVTLLSLMAEADAIKVSLAGNIGRPILDSMYEDNSDLYVLELSSFQLDITESLQANVSSILNVSPDHLDRYESYEAYALSKQKIYANSKVIIWNRDDQLTYPNTISQSKLLSFGLDEPKEFHFGLLRVGEETFLACGSEKIINCAELMKRGITDLQNALAAMAIAHSIGISYSAINDVLRTFKGLAHRCEWVTRFRDIDWVNDSKGTNVGATQAAIASVAKDSDGKSVVLIAGGDSKGGDLNLLNEMIQRHVKALVLIGRDAQLFVNQFSNSVPCILCSSLEEAVLKANEVALAGNTVLLSPACSSLDMFKNYLDRGDQFKRLALGLSESVL